MYRDEFNSERITYNFVFHQGGLGDLIAQLPAVKYVLDHHKHINIIMWVHEHTKDFIEKVFKGRKGILIKSVNHLQTQFNEIYTTRTPYLHRISNLSCHITDHGFLTLTHTIPDNKFKNYLKITPKDVSYLNLPENYVVITTGFTSPTREWNMKSIHETSEYCIQKGYTPVYLGKKQTVARENDVLDIHFSTEFSNGVNLIDQTDLEEAHGIIDKAKVIVGVDNGLLHLAGMTDTPIVAGFTSVEPNHRLPYRNNELGWNCYAVTPNRKELKCFGCQSNMNFAPSNHHFTKCWYNDYKCVTMLESRLFIEQLEKIL